jgi:hypothetical protein
MPGWHSEAANSLVTGGPIAIQNPLSPSHNRRNLVFVIDVQAHLLQSPRSAAELRNAQRIYAAIARCCGQLGFVNSALPLFAIRVRLSIGQSGRR